MPILTANSCNTTYTVTTTNDNVTIKITNITKSGTFSQKTNRTVSLKLGGTTLLTRTARKPPTKTQIASTKDHKGKITAAIKTSILSEEKTSESANIDKAWTDFLSDFNAKKNTSALTVVYTRGTEDKQHNLAFSVFGITASVTLVVAKKSEGSTPVTHDVNKTIGIENVNNGKNYVINSAAYAKYGHIERVVDFSDVKDEKQLLSLATTYANSMQFDDMSLSVSAVDLHNLTGSVPAFQLLDEVRCISDPHGLDRTFPITEITIPLDDPSGVQYTLGKTGVSSMSQSTASNAADLFKRFNKMPGANKILDTAKTEMSAILNNRTTGYVSIVQENDISQALVISNTSDWTQATKLWKFDMNGFGFSDSTVGDLGRYDNATTINADDRLYKIGMTMDGTIVADFIKTGLLEDGLGYNYWNLSTGEFRLSPNTLLGDSDILNGSVSNIEDLSDFLEASYTKEVGTKNILRKSDDFSIINISGKTWSKGGWNTYTSRTQDKVTIVNSPENGLNSIAPAPDLTKAVKLYCSHNTQGSASIRQKEVTLAVNTVYTLGCYVCGSGKLTLRVEGYQQRQYAVSISHNDWRRYNFVFKIVAKSNVESATSSMSTQVSQANTAKNNAYTSWQAAITNNLSQSVIKQRKATYDAALKAWKSKKKELDTLNITVPLKDSKTVDIVFSNSKVTGGTIAISGLTLVKGNVSSDWSPSESDVFDQIDAYNNALTQTNIMNKLTNGGTKEGIFLQDGHLYLNATYLMAGIISDKRAYNKWNLTTGYLKTTSMVADNIRASGILENTSIWSYYKSKPLYDRITVNPKGIKYTFQSKTGTKIYSGFDGQIARGSTIGSLQIAAPSLYINANNFSVVEKYTTKTKPKVRYWNGSTGTLYIKGVIQGSNKKMSQTTLAVISVMHGLVVGMSVYNSKTKKLGPVSKFKATYSGGGTFHPRNV